MQKTTCYEWAQIKYRIISILKFAGKMVKDIIMAVFLCPKTVEVFRFPEVQLFLILKLTPKHSPCRSQNPHAK